MADGPTPGWAAAADAAAHVFVSALEEVVEVGGPDGHHLARVRRLRPGETLTASDGSGRWRRYEVAAVDGGRLALSARSEVVAEPVLTPPVSVAVALVKGGLEDVVARLCEVGVASVEPFRARRSVVRWDDERAARHVERLRAVAREAAMQCRRSRVPEVRAVTGIQAFAGRPGLLVADRSGVVPAEVPLPPSGAAWTVVVGPEGGLDPSEQEALGPATRVAVGPHVLRAETAPLAVAAALVARATHEAPCGL